MGIATNIVIEYWVTTIANVLATRKLLWNLTGIRARRESQGRLDGSEISGQVAINIDVSLWYPNEKGEIHGWTWPFLRRRSSIGDIGGNSTKCSTVVVLQLIPKEMDSPNGYHMRDINSRNALRNTAQLYPAGVAGHIK